MQVKALLVEKERLTEENRQRGDMADGDQERQKQLEVKMGQIYNQKEQAVGLLGRLREALPSESLRRIMTELTEAVHEGFRLEEELQSCESQLLGMESDLRQYAKKDQ